MKVISHRGYWKDKSEKNTQVAFERSFKLGYGTETDVRDACSQLVIAHDMPEGGEISFAQMLDIAESNISKEQKLTLAINIKANGLAKEIAKEIELRSRLDCFVFDMSIPDMRNYFEAGVPVFTRMSEVEQIPVCIERCRGVWLDSFEGAFWYSKELLDGLLNHKEVCIVSAELHQRDRFLQWDFLKSFVDHPNLILCTDFPEDADSFFNEGAYEK